MPQLIVQETDDGVGQALLVIHLETGRDDARGFSGSADPRQKHEGWAACTGTLPPVLRCCPRQDSAGVSPAQAHWPLLCVRQKVNDPNSQIRHQGNQAQSPCSLASGQALHPSKSLPLVLIRG